ncbi:hypothetical protein [Ochrobactrum sp. EDr1-4]|uniref:hypothetical protein n=1 Tax=Ochrobactrum sp. EDr1-4 TaxID=3368622 RepID=UPI003BA148DC
MCSTGLSVDRSPALKEISTLARIKIVRVRYDGTLPFRAEIIAPWGGSMRFLAVDKKHSGNLIASVTRLVRPCIVFSILVIGTPASAHELDTPFYVAMQPYAVLKRTSIACGLPEDDHRAYRKRLLAIISQVEEIDISSARRALQKAYETDAQLGGLECSEALKDRYKYTVERGINRDLDYLQEEVDDYLRKSQ